MRARREAAPIGKALGRVNSMQIDKPNDIKAQLCDMIERPIRRGFGSRKRYLITYLRPRANYSNMLFAAPLQ